MAIQPPFQRKQVFCPEGLRWRYMKGSKMKMASKVATFLTLALPVALCFSGGAAWALPGDPLSLGKSCYQSSVYRNDKNNGHAEYAANGYKTGRNAFHTEADAHSWWYVDLGSVQAIGMVKIYNRMDCCAERAKSLQIFLATNAGSWGSAVYSNNGVPFGGVDQNGADAGGGPKVVDLNGAKARYLKIELKDRDFLHLDQVEVYAPMALTGAGGGGSGLPSMPSMPSF